MQRFRTYGPRDETPLPENGDLAFVGMDMRAPALVPPGFAAAALNKRIVEGVYGTRRGLFGPAWTRFASTDFPYRASYLDVNGSDFDRDYGRTTYGAGLYADPEGDTWIVRVLATALVLFRETEVGRLIPFLPGLEVTERVSLRQNFNELVIVRGDDHSSLVWSGTWSDPVEELVPDTIASGYAAVPPAHYCLAWRERTVLLAGPDDLILSRIADSTQYHATDGIEYVNRGRGDRLRAAVPIGSYSLLVLKSQGVHVYTALQADLSDARLDEQPFAMQFDSPHTAIACDGKVWWLARRGVCTAEIAQVDADNKILLRINPTVSDPIAPLIRRIAWRYAAQFTAAATQERLFFAVALDDQTAPKTLLVWNRQLGAWESYDQWNTSLDFDVLGFAADVPWLNEPRLFALSSGGKVACLEYGLGEDSLAASGSSWDRAAIADELLTRAFTAGTADPKRILRAQVHLETWNPGSVALRAIFDGPGEVLDLEPATRDRTKYFTEAPDFVPNNTENRFHDPRRQDYSVNFNNLSPSSYPDWTEGVTYALGQRVFFPWDNHEYECLAGGYVASLGNYPTAYNGIGALHWEDLGVASGAETYWSGGQAITIGDIRQFLGRKYRALIAHTTASTNKCDTNPAIWLDLNPATGVYDGLIYLKDGIRLEDHQSVIERRDIGREASWCQVSIRGSQGSVKIRAVSLEVETGARSNLPHA